jgi:protein TonB
MLTHMRVLRALILLSWMSAPAARTAPARTIYRIGHDGVSAPVVLHKNDPKYTSAARQAALEGTVRLSLIVGENGHAQDVGIIHGVGYGLDEQAVRAIRTWRFRPAMKDGAAVPVYAVIEVHFHR